MLERANDHVTLPKIDARKLKQATGLVWTATAAKEARRSKSNGEGVEGHLALVGGPDGFHIPIRSATLVAVRQGRCRDKAGIDALKTQIFVAVAAAPGGRDYLNDA